MNLFHSLKSLLAQDSSSNCPDCGWWFACPKCSERYVGVDKELDGRS
jgi:hypothetical protein